MIVESVDPVQLHAIEGDIHVYPNPATLRTRIEFDVRHPVSVTVDVVDVLGRIVTRDGFHASSGANAYDVDVDGLGAGVYFIRLTARDGERYPTRSAAVVVGA